MGIGIRLKELLNQKGWSQKMLAAHTGIAQAYISQICSNKRNPSSDVIRSICKALNVPVSRLLDESYDDNIKPEEAELIMRYRGLSRDQINVVWRMLDEFEKQNSMPATIIKLPVFSDPAAAGFPFDTGSSFEYEEFDASCVPPDADFAVRISGSSMEPTILDGQIVFVERSAELNNGDIGIFMLANEGAVCKRFYKKNTTVSLLSDNTGYTPIEGDALIDSHLVGRVLLG